MSCGRFPLILALTCAFAITSDAGGEAPSFDAQRVRWQHLEYRATKLLISATTTIDLRAVSGDEARAGLLAAERPGATAQEPGERTLEIRLESSVLGRKSIEKLWFDPHAATTLQRYKLRHGSKAYDKTQRFTDLGVLSRRRSPADDSEARALPGAGWSKVRETWYAAPPEARGCALLADPTLLFYLFSAHDWSAGRALRLCVFSNKSFSRLQVRPAGQQNLAVDYLDTGTRKQGDLEALRVELRSQSLGTDGRAFELMGLEGDVDLFLDPATGIPVEIRGRMSKLGSVEVRLAVVRRR